MNRQKTIQEHFNATNLLVTCVGGLVGIVIAVLGWEGSRIVTRLDSVEGMALRHEEKIVDVKQSVDYLAANTVSTGRFVDTMRSLRTVIGKDFDGFDGSEQVLKSPGSHP